MDSSTTITIQAFNILFRQNTIIFYTYLFIILVQQTRNLDFMKFKKTLIFITVVSIITPSFAVKTKNTINNRYINRITPKKISDADAIFFKTHANNAIKKIKQRNNTWAKHYAHIRMLGRIRPALTTPCLQFCEQFNSSFSLKKIHEIAILNEIAKLEFTAIA